MPILNDVHSRLNATDVDRIARPDSVDDLRQSLEVAARASTPISVGGGRHAMGGQQFAHASLHIDMRSLAAVRAFDPKRGHLTIEAGAQWRDIIRATDLAQLGQADPDPADRAATWGIRQKQTGADDLTLGGAIAANAHGRGLLMQPIADDIEAVEIVTLDARGRTHLHACSRDRNSDLFALAIGGYGLFGVITAATLRLGPRQRLTRTVDIIDIDDAMNAVYRRVNDGCLYGDFQYAIDPADDAFLRRGVFACYRPATAAALIAEGGELRREQWLELLKLAHQDKRRAFQLYSTHYLATHGRIVWSDTMQLSTYIPSYVEFLASSASHPDNPHHGSGPPAQPLESLVIGEMFVPPDRLLDFMAAARLILRERGVEDIYGTIRSIRQDTTSFLAWARRDFACIIFNLRTAHTSEGIARTHGTFRALIDAASALGGSFFLTYARAATPEQVRRCHPRIGEFLRRKRDFDPGEHFQSEWYRAYRPLREQ